MLKEEIGKLLDSKKVGAKKYRKGKIMCRYGTAPD